MSERTKSVLAVTIALAAVVVVVVGLAGSPVSEPTSEERVEALSPSIKCPFCNGERNYAPGSADLRRDTKALVIQIFMKTPRAISTLCMAGRLTRPRKTLYRRRAMFRRVAR